MVAEVCLGKVGAVAAREVSRFARNSRDWQQLVEMCRVVDTLLIDQETVYAPRQGNDRLLLGLKGSLNEYELDLLRQRSLVGALREGPARRARRRRPGRLRQGRRPAGEGSGPAGAGGDPARHRQGRRTRAASGRRCCGSSSTGSTCRPGEATATVVWRRPRYSTIHQMIANPAYGGAYAYGKTGRGRALRRRRCQGPAPGASRARNGWRCSPARTKVTSTGTARRRSARW